MKRPLLAGALGLGLLGAAAAVATHGQGLVVPDQSPGRLPAGLTQAAPAIVAKGKSLVDLGDCVGCHSANGGKEFAGGQLMGMPFGSLSTPNITPDADTGIGHYTDAQFLELMRNGVEPDGTHIYPAMPYAWYHTIETDDLLAIKAYLFSLQPVHAPRVQSTVWFPFTLRPAIAAWDAIFVPSGQFKPDPKLTAEQNRGAWIVGGLEHCGECHNNRNFLGNTDVALKLEGGPITRWYAPNLHSDKISGLGRYSDDDLYSFFKEGHSPAMGVVAGPMAEVIDYSTKKLPDSDIRAIIAYLRTLDSKPSYSERKPNSDSQSFKAGQAVYLTHCASCHQVNGQGVANVIPGLDGNGMARAFGPQSVIGVVIGGLEARGPYAPMPGVGSGMSDREIADVTNYVRQAWSNGAPANADEFLVHVLRKDNETVMNGKRPDGCPVLAQDDVKRVLADKSSGVDDLLHQMTLPTMLQTVDTIVAKMKTAAPDLARADMVNGLMIAYCPIAYADKSIQPQQQLWQMTHFAERLYVQSSTGGSY